MSAEILAILGMTATLLVATWTMNRSLRADLRTDVHRLEDKVDARFEQIDKKIDGLREDQHALNARMSGLEGLMQGLKEAIVARSVA